MNRTLIVAELGINHNGNLDIAKELIKAARLSGCDAVKFQKRTVDLVYTDAELDRPRKSPFGMTNRDLKDALEFDREEYEVIDRYCRQMGIPWFASCWDKTSVDFIHSFGPPFYKIASPFLWNKELLQYTADKGVPIILSTGAAAETQIREAIEIFGRKNIINLMHCVYAYPASADDLNLSYIPKLKEKFGLEVGYSNHVPEVIFSVVAVALGARMIEFHFTLDRGMWGSDQASSLEPQEVESLVKYIRSIEKAMGDGKKKVHDKELTTLKRIARMK